MQVHTGKIVCGNTNHNMQNLLQFSKESDAKSEKMQSFDTPAVEVSFSKEGMAALREQQKQTGYAGYIESRELAMAEETKHWISNEVEWEHYSAMREITYQTLKDGNYDVEDLMKSMMETYEITYNQIVEAHKDCDRQFVSEITGTRSITLEEDLAALDAAYQWRLSNLEGYITCQQTNKQFENPGDISWYLERIGWRRTEEDNQPNKEISQEDYNYLDKDYIATAISMMEQARQEFLTLVQNGNYRKGMAVEIISDILNQNTEFAVKTQKLFS